jgi:hypothetical protein
MGTPNPNLMLDYSKKSKHLNEYFEKIKGIGL